MNTSNISQGEISRLKREVYEVVINKLGERNLPYEVQVTIYDDVMTTGVQGDNRTYCPLVEITLLEKEEIIWDKEFIAQISTEIPNKVRGTNRVVITVPYETT